MCMHAENLHREAMDNYNDKIMRHNDDDLLTICYQEDDCSGASIQTPPGTDCCNLVGFPYIYQKRPSPAGPICCSW